MIRDMVAYEFTEDFGPPLSREEKSDTILTDRFREEFPDGKVAIHHGISLGLGESLAEWASVTLGIYDRAHQEVKDVDACHEFRAQFLNTYGLRAKEDGGFQMVQDRRAAVRGLLDQGLSIRQIGSYTQRDPREIARLLRGKADPGYAADVETDDEVVKWVRGERTEPTMCSLARALGVSDNIVRRLAHSHGFSGPDAPNNTAQPDYYAIIRRVATLRFAEKLQPRVVIATIRAEYPKATWLTDHALRFWCRKDTQACQRYYEGA